MTFEDACARLWNHANLAGEQLPETESLVSVSLRLVPGVGRAISMTFVMALSFSPATSDSFDVL